MYVISSSKSLNYLRKPERMLSRQGFRCLQKRLDAGCTAFLRFGISAMVRAEIRREMAAGH
jgi:hypothetical protein